MTRKTLTQYDEVILKYFEKNKSYHSLNSICEITKLNHPQKVRYRLNRLEGRGYLIDIGKKSYKVNRSPIDYVSQEEINRLRSIEKKYNSIKDTYKSDKESLLRTIDLLRKKIENL